MFTSLETKIVNVIKQRFCSLPPIIFPNLSFHPSWRANNKHKFAQSFLIYDDFISEDEERSFMAEMEPHLKRHVYEKDHWDDVSCKFQVHPFMQLKHFRLFKVLEKQNENFSTKKILQ